MSDADRRSDGATDGATSNTDPAEPSTEGKRSSPASGQSPAQSGPTSPGPEEVGLTIAKDEACSRDSEADEEGRTTMVDGQAPAAESSYQKSSIRPMPDWRSPALSLPRVPTPMVVVYSGDSRRPRAKRDPEDAPSRPSNVSLEQLGFREPFGLAEDLDETASDGQTPGNSSGQPHEVEPPPSSAAWRVLDDSRQKLASVGPAAHAAAARVYHWLIQSRFGPAALVALVAAVIITLLLATRPESVPVPPPRAESEPDRATVSAVEEPAITPPPQREAVVQPLQPRVPHTKGPDQASGVNQRVRRVAIQVLPVDAKVVYRGVKRPGPPYEVEVPIGKRIALEVVRKGFVTRRLVIDGSEAKVRVALVAERHNKTTRPEQQDHEELAEPRDEPPATEEADDGLTDEAPLISEPVGRHAAP